MTPGLVSWFLAIPYFIVALGFMALAWAAGGLAFALLSRVDFTDENPWNFALPGVGFLQLMVRVAAGFALFSWGGAILGLVGQFTLPNLLCAVFALVASGLYMAHRFALPQRPALLRDRLYLGEYWIAATRTERVFAGAIILAFCAFALNSIVGAMVPDMNQDPMWYHLPLPQQWMFDHAYGVYPNSLQSAYPLAVESLFAEIFTIGGDSIMCALLSATSGVAFLLTVTIGAWCAMGSCDARHDHWKMWGTMAALGICAPLFITYGLMAPVPPKNDMVMLFWASTGCMTLIAPLMGARRLPSAGWWIVGGFLLGTAVVAKPTSVNLAFFTMLFASALAIFQNRIRREKSYYRLCGDIACGCAAILIAAAPWLIRGYMATGVPLYPVGVGLFTLRPEYLPMQQSLSKIQAVPGLGLSEWIHKIAAFPDRLRLGAANGEKFIFVYMIAAALGIITTKGRWRWLSVVLILQMIFLIGLKAGVEIYRFFAPSYCLAVPIVAFLVAKMAPRMRPALRYGAAVAIFIATLAAVSDQQYRLATQTTLHWEFRPMLSQEDRVAYAKHAELGWLYLDFPLVAPLIEKDERVFLLGVTYPFYLHRDTLWNDEVVKEGGVARRWAGMNPEQAKAFLKRQGIDVILYAGNAARLISDSPVEELANSGVLQKITIADKLAANGWALYRVTQ